LWPKPAEHHCVKRLSYFVFYATVFAFAARTVRGQATSVTAAPGTLTFSYQIGAAALPAAQNLNVTTAPAAQNFVITTAGSPANAAWLLVSTTAGRAPATVRVQVNPTGLPAGTYSATITVAGTSGSPPPQTVVSVTLQVSAPPATISATPAALNFTYLTGSPIPHSSLTSSFILSSNGTPLSAVISVSGGSWLRVTPTGNISLVGLLGTITATADPTGLVPGIYTSTIRISAPASANRTLNVTVSLTVSAAEPLITGTWPNGLTQGASSAIVTLFGANFFATSSVAATGLTANSTVTVTDASAASVSETFSIPIFSATASHFRIMMASPLPAGTVGSAYAQALSAAGGSGTITWSVPSGTLPPGMTLAAGVLIGTPTTAGTYFFHLAATDSTTPFAQTAYQPFRMTVYPAASTALRITAAAAPIPSGAVLASYTATNLTAAGGTAPYTWSATNLPGGLTLSAGGSLSGTPSTVGTTGPLTMTPVSPSSALVSLTTPMLANEGTLRLSITTPAPGGGASNEAHIPIYGSAPQITGVLNSASYTQGSLSPGEIITIFGLGLGPTTLAMFDPATPPIPTALPAVGSQTTVTINGTNATLLYTSVNQVAAIVPYSVSGATAQVVVTYGGVSSQPFTVALTTTNPGLYTLASSGSGQGAILNYNAATNDYSVNTQSTPAQRGSIVVLFVTGAGTTTSSVINQLIPDSPAITPTSPVSVEIGGQAATVIAAVAPPGSVPGILQINVTVPANSATGNNVPVVVTIGTVTTQPGVTMAVR
jgi:uncharacterized protein (TIGR03437 family)